MIERVLRTPKGVAAVDTFPGFGTVIRTDSKVTDPEGLVISDDMTKAIRLTKDFVKIPRHLVARIVDLYIRMLAFRSGKDNSVVDTNQEVSVVLLRDVETMSKWRVLVPTQEVGGASVAADYTKEIRDIETGEVVTWVPDGWAHAGSSHSHNTMGAFFSGTDDANELPVPGIHFVCGSFQLDEKKEFYNYQIAVSIVYHGKRYQRTFNEETGEIRDLSFKDLMETGGEEKAHDDVMKLITTTSYPLSIARGSKSYSYESDSYTRYGGYGGYGTYSDPAGKEYLASSAVPELELMSLDSYADWLEHFDEKCSKSNASTLFSSFTPTLAKDKAPILVYPTKKELYHELDDADLRYSPTPYGLTEKNTLYARRLWGVKQVSPGIDDFKVALITVVIGNPGDDPRFFAHIGRNFSKQQIEMFPIWNIQIKELLKKQAEGIGVIPPNGRGRRKIAAIIGGRVPAEDKDDDDLDLPFVSSEEYNKANVAEFTTRGVKASDFTSVEIERLVAAWVTNVKQRSDLRAAIQLVRNRLDNRKGGKDGGDT